MRWRMTEGSSDPNLPTSSPQSGIIHLSPEYPKEEEEVRMEVETAASAHWPLTCQQDHLRSQAMTPAYVATRLTDPAWDPLSDLDANIFMPMDTGESVTPQHGDWSAGATTTPESQKPTELIEDISTLSPCALSAAAASSSAHQLQGLSPSSLQPESRQSITPPSHSTPTSSQSDTTEGRRRTSRELVEGKDADLERLIDKVLEIEQTASASASPASLATSTGPSPQVTLEMAIAAQQIPSTTVQPSGGPFSGSPWCQSSGQCSFRQHPQMIYSFPAHDPRMVIGQQEPMSGHHIKQERLSPESFKSPSGYHTFDYGSMSLASHYTPQSQSEAGGYVARETSRDFLTSSSSTITHSHQRESDRARGQLVNPSSHSSELGQHQPVVSHATAPAPASHQPAPAETGQSHPVYYPLKQPAHQQQDQQQLVTSGDPSQAAQTTPRTTQSEMFFLPGSSAFGPQFTGYYPPGTGYYYGGPITTSSIFSLPPTTGMSRFMPSRKNPSLSGHPEFFRASVSSPEMEYPPSFFLPPTPGPSKSYPTLDPLHSAVTCQSLVSGYGLPMPHQGILRTLSEAVHFTPESQLEPVSPQSSVSTKFSDPVSRRSSQGASTSSHGSPSPSAGPLSPSAQLSLFQPICEASVCGPSHGVSSTELLYLTTVAASKAQQVAAMGEQKVCAVCGDNASCAHYGVRTCEGCKGFFKRTVQKKAQYVCMGNKDCPIDKRRRNRCQYCRFQKCLNVGMVKEVVRHGSLRGRRGRLPSKTKCLGSEDPPSPPVPLITSLARAYTDTKQTTTSIEPMIWSDEIASTSSAVAPVVSEDRFLQLLVMSFETIRNWSERIPGYSELPQMDQDILLNNSFFHILALRMAYRSLETVQEECVIFEDGNIYPLRQCPETWKEFLTAVIREGQQLKEELEVDLATFTCLCALALTQPEHLQLEDQGRADQLRSTLINALKDHCTSTANGTSKRSQYFAQLLGKLSQVQSTAAIGKQALATCQNRGVAVPLCLQGTLH